MNLSGLEYLHTHQIIIGYKPNRYKVYRIVPESDLMTWRLGDIINMNSHLTDTPPIQILEESQKGVVQDIKKEVDDSVAMNFGDRIHHPKWQVRRRLY